MPSDSKASESAALSLRSPGTVEEYPMGHTDNALVERGTLSVGLLMAFPAGMAFAGIAVYRGGAVNLAFGFGTLLLIIAANFWWFLLQQGWREFEEQFNEQKKNTELAAENLLKVQEERSRNNELHKPTLEKATYDAQTSKLKLMIQQFKGSYLAKLEAKEEFAKLDSDLEAKWKAAMDATKEATSDDELALDVRQSKEDEARKKIAEFDEESKTFIEKLRKLLNEKKDEELDSFEFSRGFWESVVGETDGQSSRKFRRGSAPNDGLPSLLRETCTEDLCQRVWYSNTIQETGRKRDIATEDVIHKIYHTPIDYDFRNANKEKRKNDDPDWEISPQDAECYEEEDVTVDGKPYHSVLELKGAGKPSDIADLSDYIQKNQDEALHKVGEAISKGKKFKADNGKEITIILHEGWSCVGLTVNGNPAIWGLHGLFDNDKDMQGDHKDIWTGCGKSLKITNSS